MFVATKATRRLKAAHTHTNVENKGQKEGQTDRVKGVAW